MKSVREGQEMEVLDSVKTEGFEFVAVKHEPAEDMETVEPAALQGFEFVAVKHEPAEDMETTEPAALQVPGTGDPLEMLQIEIKEDNPPGPNERALNGVRILQSASGDSTSTSKEGLVNPSTFVSLQPSPHICKLCGEVFPDAVSMSKHDVNNREKPCAPAGMQTLKSVGVDSWLCEICHKRFKSKDFLKTHMLGHATEIEKNTSSVSEDPDFEECRRQLVKSHPYRCEVCGKYFSEAAKLVRHANSHSGVHPYKCNVCGKSFGLLCTMKRHKLTHTGERPYICDICGRSYSRSDRLDSHKHTHTGKLPYSCEFCGKGFRDAFNLQRHKRLHTGERPYSCDVCGRTFAVSTHVKEHRKTHEKKKVYTCDDCGATFTQSHALIVVRCNGEKKRICEACFKQNGKFRRRRPTGVTGPLPMFNCEDCGKPFDRISGLERHKRTHTGERPFVCEHCGRSFGEARGLKIHVCNNMEGPPYVCQVCGKCFDISSSLNKHKALKHKM